MWRVWAVSGYGFERRKQIGVLFKKREEREKVKANEPDEGSNSSEGQHPAVAQTQDIAIDRDD